MCVFKRLVATRSRAPPKHGFEHVTVICSKIGPELTKYIRGCPAGTGGYPESGNPSKVRSRALVFWSTAISKSSFTKNQGEPPQLSPCDRAARSTSSDLDATRS